jgi:signal transduction histidine kinase
VALFTASVLVLFSFIYWSSVRYMADQSDAAIRSEINTLSERYENRGLSGLRHLISDRIDRQQPTGTSIYLLTDPLGRVIVGNINRWPKTPVQDGWLNFNLETRDLDKPSLHSARARQFQLTGSFRLLVGQDIQELNAARLRIITALGWGVALMLVLGLAGGFFISRRMLTRIEIINDTSQRIMAGDLGRRVPVGSRGDEFDQLSNNLNRMLDQIQELLDGIRQVSDNIAHDLKTPLSRLRQRLESLRESSALESEQARALEQAINEADRLLGLFNALLRIARIESESISTDVQPLVLGQLAKDVVELYEPLAEEKHQKLKLLESPQSMVHADRDMLFQALANVLDNAVKYTPVGGIIEVNISNHEGQPVLSVCDSGPGIAEADQDKVFQRFYRGDVSRSSAGNGLGLSLVSAVTRHHGARVCLTGNDPGLCVKLIFPQAQN